MRELRAACVNREELEAMFLALIADVDYAAATIWDLGSRQFEVDTHPIRGDGRNGRIWLFHDVTAERRSEAALRTLATSDALTGIANRRHFEERARAAIEAARLSGDPLSLLMIDIDHFKAINDGFGHPAGDEVLRVIAGRCADALGPRDLIARLGGEEFGVLLPATSPDKALLIARQLCTTIADTPVLAGATSIEVRASIGGAATTDSDTLDALLARADAALYYSKRNGRARVTFEGVTPVA
jgi:diguanylate cyclase (GGDEF)-like protein